MSCRSSAHGRSPRSSRSTVKASPCCIAGARCATFYDDTEVRRTYYAEAEHVLAEATGARRVFVFDHTVRRRVLGVDDRAPGTPRQPATRVHVDHTAKSGPQRVRDLLRRRG